MRNLFTWLICVAMVLPAVWAAVPSGHVRIGPTIPAASRQRGDRVILERADRLHKEQTDTFMLVIGNVEFSKGPMLMFCDSAEYYAESGSFNAFGNVRMEQGDTLFVYADELNYDGPGEIAYLYGPEPGRPVRLINRDVKLETDIFTYDMLSDVGYYNTWGVLTDPKNRLTSLQGEYIPSTKDANFYGQVHLNSRTDNNADTLNIYTDTLYYNTNTNLAEFYTPTTIVNSQGVIRSTDGWYNTVNNVAEFYQHSVVRTTRGTTLEGDTLFYDRKTGIGEAFGNMALVDSVRQSTIKGDYGFYNELIDSAYVTGRALAMEYSRGDTLYMHGRQIQAVTRIDSIKPTKAKSDSLSALGSDLSALTDTTHVVTAWPRVRFYRTDMQGLCDSMIFVERDSMLHMHHNPIVWNGENGDQQLFGNLILVHLNDSTVDRADLPDFALSAQRIEGDEYFNQLTGKQMTALMADGHLHQLDVSGSVEAIFFPEENDTTINKLVNVQSSFMTVWMAPGGQTMQRMKMWPQTQGTVTPLYLAKHSQLLLPKFKWYGTLRPVDPSDVFNVSAEMDELMGATPASSPETAITNLNTTQTDEPQPDPEIEPKSEPE